MAKTTFTMIYDHERTIAWHNMVKFMSNMSLSTNKIQRYIQKKFLYKFVLPVYIAELEFDHPKSLYILIKWCVDNNINVKYEDIMKGKSLYANGNYNLYFKKEDDAVRVKLEII